MQKDPCNGKVAALMIKSKKSHTRGRGKRIFEQLTKILYLLDLTLRAKHFFVVKSHRRGRGKRIFEQLTKIFCLSQN